MYENCTATGAYLQVKICIKESIGDQPGTNNICEFRSYPDEQFQKSKCCATSIR